VNKNSIKELKLTFEALSVYRGLLQNKVIGKLQELINCLDSESAEISPFIKSYNEFYNELISDNGLYSLRGYILNCILTSDNLFSHNAEIIGMGQMESRLERAAAVDLDYLESIAYIKAEEIKSLALKDLCKTEFEANLIKNLPDWDFSEDKASVESFDTLFFEMLRSSKWSKHIDEIKCFHRYSGCGIFTKHKGFIWEDSSMKGIESPDGVRLSDLTGYELERKIVIDNTVQFIEGHSANNVLLYGDRGTGKSSTVKALLNEYYSQGLRMIEIPKSKLSEFPQILNIVKGRKQRFIFFIDDLVFGDNEESYTSLKAVLEGGLQSRPENVAIYATSNRRHLIKEKFSDRNEGAHNTSNDEIRTADTVQEKLSLADRFGITVTFSSPDKIRYLKIVEDIAQRRGLKVEKETLHSEALKWELRYNGRSPRTAVQFIDWFCANHDV
jgi:uncharacterized protein